MKIKTDFVTNSSSTSFILAFNSEKSNKEVIISKLIKAFGIKNDSILKELFEDFLYHLNYEEFDKKNLTPYQLNIYKDEFEKIDKLRKKGFKIYIGNLRSENEFIESFLCQDIFYVESDEVYFNGIDNAW
jgi:hypothetical protein